MTKTIDPKSLNEQLDLIMSNDIVNNNKFL